MLGDQAYGDNTELRERLDAAGREYVLAVAPADQVFAPETVFAVPEQTGRQAAGEAGRGPTASPRRSATLIARLDADQSQTVAFRDGPDGEP